MKGRLPAPRKPTKPSTLGPRIAAIVEKAIADKGWICSLDAEGRKIKLPTLGIHCRDLSLQFRLPQARETFFASLAISIRYQTVFAYLTWPRAKGVHVAGVDEMLDFYKAVAELAWDLEHLSE